MAVTSMNKIKSKQEIRCFSLELLNSEYEQKDWHIQLTENVGMQTNEQVTTDFVNMIIDFVKYPWILHLYT